MSKGKTITLWIVSALVAALFLFAGGFKLLKPEMAKQGFVQMGYAAWFAIFIGICEVLGGIGVLIPRVAGLAAACLSVIMVGAVYTVASHHMYKDAVVPAITFVLLIFVAYTRFTGGRSLRAQATSPGR
ncbi:MAG TPA: DoxX family protein [Candidatus Angelobacter sp.]|jgi:putative oxidoreductase|nr:DoxX family protein [Candidatus Angelobacter sp.]